MKISKIYLLGLALVFLLFEANCKFQQPGNVIAKQIECTILVDSSFVKLNHADAIDYTIFYAVQFNNNQESDLAIGMPCCNIESIIHFEQDIDFKSGKYKLFGSTGEDISDSILNLGKGQIAVVFAYRDSYVLIRNQSYSQLLNEIIDKHKHETLYYYLENKRSPIIKGADLFDKDKVHFVNEDSFNYNTFGNAYNSP
ncbi:MAG TPA: hypothetical protein PLB46_11995 [Chitinophagales bacterium]|nr:hypothetical protein [Chitinophagales bacterium]